ncbi:hypothetical protein AB0N73_08370 [Microbacterium sp. NPDC089189]|uniref:hypothetical protein n=1 Tax=Microbacterium sp. NPDC089189 TaxID=3154972 RepID=UPI0034231E8F
MGHLLESWSEFNVAMVSATAALAGLVIVAASVNITQIVASRTLTARLGTGVASLVLALVVCGLGLVPALPAPAFGVVVLAVTIVAGSFQGVTARLILIDPSPADRARLLKSLLGFLPVLAYLIAGVLAFTHPAASLVAAAAGALLAIVAAVVVSWVALVEVLR